MIGRDEVLRRASAVELALRAAADAGVLRSRLQLQVDLGEHSLTRTLRQLSDAGLVATNGLSRSAARWLWTGGERTAAAELAGVTADQLSPPPSSDTPAPATSTGRAEQGLSAGTRAGGLRIAIAEALDLDPTRCTDEDLVDDVREAAADRAEAEAEVDLLRAELQALDVLDEVLDGAGAPHAPARLTGVRAAAWRLAALLRVVVTP